MAKKDPEQTWDRLWEGICELSSVFEEGIVFIGGIAVYVHAQQQDVLPVEFSHDADFYISLADFGELREIEEVTRNKRLHKCQIIKNDVAFDVYVERQSDLVVSYEDIETASVVIDNVRVASLEHLLILKLEAYRDRRGSKKGEKDERDVIRLGYLLRTGVDHELVAPYLSEEITDTLLAVERSAQFSMLCDRNAQMASRLRADFRKTVDDVIGRKKRR